MRATLFYRTAVGAVAIALLLPLAAITPLTAQQGLQRMASGLDNPRDLRFGPDGALYVVEAGRGGSSGLCLPSPEGGSPVCYGPTGGLTRILAPGVQERVVTGLPSLAGPDGNGAIGASDIDFALGRAWITIGLGANPALRAPFEAAGIKLGHLVRVLPSGQWDYVVDLAAHEARFNPDRGAVDSNPYSLRVIDDGAVIADAGANALLRVGLDTAISTLAVFPARNVTGPGGASISMQSVPTVVTNSPEGFLLVGELTGFPFPVGAARVYRVPRAGGTPVTVATGFTNIIDLALDQNGALWVLEHDADGLRGPGQNGRLVRVNANGTHTTISDQPVRPGGLAIGLDGAIYVTNRGASAGTGEVWRFFP
jgi:hypothetical protein